MYIWYLYKCPSQISYSSISETNMCGICSALHRRFRRSRGISGDLGQERAAVPVLGGWDDGEQRGKARGVFKNLVVQSDDMGI